VAVFFIALMESLVLLGLLIPGAALLFGAGALIATGALPLYPILIWTILGAAVGDIISFLLGSHYHQRLRVIWPFKRYPLLVNRGVDFFVRNGGKSIFMARFFGPLRPIVPAIAGMMSMSTSRFLVIDGIACVLWAPVYILPGMVFGASLGLAAEVAGRLVVLLVAIAGFAWASVWLASNAIRLLQPHAINRLGKILDWSRNHPHIRPLAGSLLDPAHPEARGLTILSIWFFITLWLLLLISRQVLHGEFLGGIDAYVFYTLDELRTPWADTVMLFFTCLGDRLVLACIMAAGCAWLFFKGNSKAALHWLAAYTCAGLLTWILKISTRIPRPVVYDDSFSFPSAHAGMSVVVYGFLALLIARELPHTRRWLPYSCAGLSLGIFWVALIGIAYDRHPAPRLPVRRLLLVTLLATILASGWQAQHNADNKQRYYTAQPELHRITYETWRNSEWQALPAWRIDLEGSDEQPLNFQWAGTLDTLQHALLTRGWHTAPALTPLTAMNWLAPAPDIDTLPVLPEVNDGQHPQLLMIAPHDSTSQQLTVLYLWPSNRELLGTRNPVWVGKVSHQYMEDTLPLITYLRSAKNYVTPLQQLAETLRDVQGIAMHQRQRPAAADDIEWSGEVLLAWHP
jgi:undecaprenyl-diphosphatase